MVSLLGTGYGQSFDFMREKIEIKVKDSHCHLRGEYYFKNPSNKPLARRLYYPFIINKDMPFPDSVSVVDSLNGDIIPFARSDSGVSFTINIPAKSIVIYVVNYYQQTPAKKMEYILTTTQTWGKPFVQAEYIVRLLPHLKLIFCSLPLKLKNDNLKNPQFYVKKENYMPDKNLLIKWKEN